MLKEHTVQLNQASRDLSLTSTGTFRLAEHVDVQSLLYSLCTPEESFTRLRSMKFTGGVIATSTVQNIHYLTAGLLLMQHASGASISTSQRTSGTDSLEDDLKAVVSGGHFNYRILTMSSNPFNTIGVSIPTNQVLERYRVNASYNAPKMSLDEAVRQGFVSVNDDDRQEMDLKVYLFIKRANPTSALTCYGYGRATYQVVEHDIQKNSNKI